MPDDINEPTGADAPLPDAEEATASPDAQLGGGTGENTAEPEAPPATPGTEPPSPLPPTPPAPPESPTLPRSAGQRRLTRHTTTTTMQSESRTTTDETVVEDIALAPPVWAAPAGEHPRPVG
ncbi:hypothetical protein E9529_05435 [Blastococcus sp. KM273128]|uniref:hypothetical protein n=1 Tax=Blastococcus sp. KM273128 TaxID=2570314 RepID=UPI001F3D5D64|nr:hypothetical protein [Blastococcus sp. KM273128]MCF6743726.1 hypothetical protein [Blastococcus sp. KM273128]